MQRQRVEFWQGVQGIIFIDESGINLSLTRMYARSPRGQRARGNRPQKRGQNVSLIGAIGLDGLITQVSLLGATDGLSFEAFIAQRLVPKLWAEACVLMDNASIHRGAEIEALITAAGAGLISHRLKTVGQKSKACCAQFVPERILI